jgi:hypothetical protein
MFSYCNIRCGVPTTRFIMACKLLSGRVEVDDFCTSCWTGSDGAVAMMVGSGGWECEGTGRVSVRGGGGGDPSHVPVVYSRGVPTCLQLGRLTKHNQLMLAYHLRWIR